VIVVTPYLVKPVNANEIKLPTDGFRTASEAQEFIGYRSHAGESGVSRPMPTASVPSNNNPDVSNLDPQAIVPGNAPQPSQASDKPKTKDRRAETPAPGFSL